MKNRQTIKRVSRVSWIIRQTRKNSLLLALFFALSTAVFADPADIIQPLIVTLAAGANATQIQLALDSLPLGGGEVVLPPGKITVTQPIVLDRSGQALCGAGEATILFLADNANCPVIIMGQPVNRPRNVNHLRVSNLSIDGNRAHQERENWRLKGEGSGIRNNGITIQDVSDSVVENVTTANCRSGGLVTTLNTRRLLVRVDPVLVKAVNARAFWIQPDGAGLGLAEFGAIGVGDERQREAENRFRQLLPRQLDSRGDIPPLIAAADLQFTIHVPRQHHEIERLQEHVTEFGVTDAALAIFHARANAFLGHHLVHGKMLPDITQEFEEQDALGPGRIVHQARRVLPGLKIQQPGQLDFYTGDIAIQDFFGQQLALLRLATGIADASGRATGHGDGRMPEQLEPSQRQQRNEISHVQAVRRRIKTAIKRDGRGSFLGQFRFIRAIGKKTTPFKFFQNAHGSRIDVPSPVAKITTNQWEGERPREP